MAFRFRHFTVEDGNSALRVGTDAMLLGSWADPCEAESILDIGTGCGLLALMMAQKSMAFIHAIDVDEPSVIEAQTNFDASPWTGRIVAERVSLQDLARSSLKKFDFIISNPPFFSGSLKSPDQRISRAKHDEQLTLEDLCHCTLKLLAPSGRLTVILPVGSSRRFTTLCQGGGLYPLRKLTVFPKPGAALKRVLMEFGGTGTPLQQETELTILDATGKYTSEYLALTADFHCFNQSNNNSHR
jgi:tRNA1Val (adenine37-N6)-methyltransferase